MTNQIKINIDDITKNNTTNEYLIRGWAIDLESKLELDIVIDSTKIETLQIKKIFRMDVNSLFELPETVYTGFEISFKLVKTLRNLTVLFKTSTTEKLESISLTKRIRIVPGTETKLQIYKMKFNKGIVYLRKNGLRNAYHRFKLERNTDNKEYAYWIFKNEYSKLDEIQAQSSFDTSPKISIIMPTYNPNLKFLAEAIESIEAQTYGNWELCIADDASTQNEVKDFLHFLEKKNNDKYKIIIRKENGHICEASNSAIQMATGTYIAFMDQDDLLAKNALMEVVKVINERPNTALIYSDEDKIDASNNRFEPHFKPGWSPNLLTSTNYISHFSVYEKNILTKIGGLRKGYEGSQDYDLNLRVTEIVEDSQIVHISKILYHWRAIEGSTALHANEKKYTNLAGKLALEDRLNRLKLSGKVTEEETPGFYSIFYDVIREDLVSIIIPTKNGFDDLKACIDSIIEKTEYKNYEIIVADNGSTDSDMFSLYKEYEMKLKNRFLVKSIDIPFNYSRINNIAAKKASGSYLLFLNNDTKVINGSWLTNMVSLGQFENIGCVGAKLIYPDETVQHAGVIMGLGNVAGHGHHYFPRKDIGYFGRLISDVNYLAVTAACVLVKKADFEAVAGFDETFEVAFNDVDLCLKIYELGRFNVWAHNALLYHFESKSRGYETTPEKMIRFEKEKQLLQSKWMKYIEDDPFYSPHLTKGTGNFSINLD